MELAMGIDPRRLITNVAFLTNNQLNQCIVMVATKNSSKKPRTSFYPSCVAKVQLLQ